MSTGTPIFHDDRTVVGRVVRLNRQPFTILGVAPRDFNGTLVFFNPAMFVPLVEHPCLGGNDLTTRRDRWVFDVMGYLKPGVSPAQAVAIPRHGHAQRPAPAGCRNARDR